MPLLERIRLGLAATAAKTTVKLVRGLNLGAGSVLPGKIARRLHPRVLPLLFQQLKLGAILIVGTNGKTTTSLLLRSMLANNGDRVVHNATGANLIDGLIAALIENTNALGQLQAERAILEVDENILPLVLQECQPKFIVALNLFRDQLDRYGEIDTISQRWQKAISPLPKDTTIVINADDPTLCYLGQKLSQKVLYFGLSEPELYLSEIPHAVDSIYCPNCGNLLDYQGVYLSHLGDYNCPKCNFSKSKTAIDSKNYPQILVGVYNKYNTLAASLIAREIGIENRDILATIKNFRAAFGRAEELTIENKIVRILLSKNPVGTNETIRTVARIKQDRNAPVTLIVLNDRTPDGTDVSWIWDVDTEQLTANGGILIVSGDRCYDMALRLQYSRDNLETIPKDFQLIIQEDLKQAITIALAKTPPQATLHILPTYSAMLEIRQILTGKKIF